MNPETLSLDIGFWSNLLMVLAVVGGPVLLGFLFYRGQRASRQRGNEPRMQEVTERGTEMVYSSAERERDKKEQAAESSKPIDVAERKAGLTG